MLNLRDGLPPAERMQLFAGLSPAQVETVAAMQGPVRVVVAETLETRLLRDIDSQRQLQAVMTDFWLNHFNVYVTKSVYEPYTLPAYQHDVILPRSLGRFEDLLVAVAKSPAMLNYLDNWQSIGPHSVAGARVSAIQKFNPTGRLAGGLPNGINENYARELMELHTLGVGGGYTQADVIEVARCFTGWTVDAPYTGGRGSFVFEPSLHEPGDKHVLGHTIHEGGMQEGLQVLHILATSPATAKLIATELAVRFVSDAPPQALVDRMAATFLQTDGDISAVLTTMFHAPEFWAPETYRAKVKTPLEFLVSALRASNANVINAVPLAQALERMGMPLYGMQTPNGYSWNKDEWVSSSALVSRMNFALLLSENRIVGTQTNWPALLGARKTAPSQQPSPAVEPRLETLLLGEPASQKTRSTVLTHFHDGSVQTLAGYFNAKPAPDDADNEVSSNMGNELMYSSPLRKPRAASDGQSTLAATTAPVTPLDTMAGLLLGSPDFQQR
jgi:uncharacterized protein (DUF1800 family)